MLSMQHGMWHVASGIEIEIEIQALDHFCRAGGTVQLLVHSTPSSNNSESFVNSVVWYTVPGTTILSSII